MYDELVKRLRAAAIMSDALSVFLPHSEGSAVAKLYNEAADAIEELSKERIEGTCQTCARSSDMCGGNITQCPIEEHYALPLDGYCHLYEPPEEELA